MNDKQIRKVSIIFWLVFLGAAIFKFTNISADSIAEAVDVLAFVFLLGIANLILGLYKEIDELKKKLNV